MFVCACRSTKPRCRPSFRQIQLHLEIASQEWLSVSESDLAERQASDFVACLLVVVAFNVNRQLRPLAFLIQF